MNDKQKQLLDAARSLIGTPYKYAVPPETMDNFFDCSSFTQRIYKQIGIDIPRSSIAQATIGQQFIDALDKKAYTTAGKEIGSFGDAEPGDLIFFRSKKGHYNDEWFPNKNVHIGHVAMYIGDNKVIHAASINKKVMEESLEGVMGYEGPIVMIKRVL